MIELYFNISADIIKTTIIKESAKIKKTQTTSINIQYFFYLSLTFFLTLSQKCLEFFWRHLLFKNGRTIFFDIPNTEFRELLKDSFKIFIITELYLEIFIDTFNGHIFIIGNIMSFQTSIQNRCVLCPIQKPYFLRNFQNL